MKKKSIFLILVCVALLSVFSFAAIAGADGNVAQIGTTEYETLQAAVTSAGESDVIKLIKDVTLTGDEEITIPENKKITIDGNGHTISFEQKSVFNKKSGLSGTIQLSVSNVTFIGTNASSASYPVVTGRNFTGSVSLDKCTFKNIRKCAVYMDPNGTAEAKLSITNCTYDNTPLGYSIDMTRPADCPFNVAVTFTGNTGLGQDKEFEIFKDTVVIGNDGKFKGQYKTLDDAFDAAKEGDTITVLADTTLASNKTINKTLILDLGGKTVTPAGGFTTTQNDRFGLLTVNGGNLTVKNGTIDSNNIGKAVIGVVGAAEDKDSVYSKLTIDSDAKVVDAQDEGWGIYLLNSNYGGNGSAYDAQVDIKGEVDGCVFVVGTVHGGDSVINITGKVDKGVYLNGFATVNVKEGAEIKSTTYWDNGSGVEVRAGNLNVKGGTITSTGDPASVDPNESGSTTVGCAVAVSQHSTKLPINVNITGGELKGVYAFREVNPQGNANTDLDKITLSVSGGKFHGQIESVYTKDFITGGLYSSTVDANLVAPDYECVENDAATEGGYPYVVREKRVAAIGGTTYPTLAKAVSAAQNNDIITLLSDIVLTENAGVTIPAGLTVTLDLNGKNLSNNLTADGPSQIILNNGDLTIQDTSEGANGSISTYAAPDSIGNWHTNPRRNWNTVAVNNGGTLTLKSGKIVSTADGGIAYAIDNGSAATLNIDGGTVETMGAVEAIRMIIYSSASTCTVNINGGTITGSGAVWMQACGANVKGVLNITGGTLNTKTGYRIVGFEADNAGTTLNNVKVNVSGGNFAKGSGATNNGYPFETENYAGANATFEPCYIELTGGLFHMRSYNDQINNKVGDLNDLCAPGYACVDNTADSTKTAYPYVVKPVQVEMPGKDDVTVTEDNKVTVGGEEIEVEGTGETGQPTAQDAAEAIAETLNNPEVTTFADTNIDTATPATKKAATQADGFNLSMVLDALKTEAVNNHSMTATAVENAAEKVKLAESVVADTDVTKKINVDLTAAAVETTTTGTSTATVTSMTFEVKPIATITVTTDDNEPVTVTAVIPNNAITAPITFRLPVDSSVTEEWAAVYHEGEFMGNFEIQTENGKKFIELSSMEFSEFKYVLVKSADAEAKIDEVPYQTLDEAVAAVKDDETITLLKNSARNIKISRVVTFTVDRNSKNFTGNITAGEGYQRTVTINDGGTLTYKFTEIVPVEHERSAEYKVTAADAANGDLTTSAKYADAGETVTITVAPDEGFTLETLTVTDKKGKEVEVKNLGNNKYSFKMPASNVTVTATFMEDNAMLNFCVDVHAGDYFYDAVLWAYENGICKGVDNAHFGPYAPIKRAEVVTFLWRAAGCPDPVGTAAQFTDVIPGSYYEKAVAWAIEEGITKGTSDTTFSPEEICKRGQIVAFLARFAGVEDTETASIFTDVQSTDYFAAAVAWAAENGITEGMTTTTFCPYNDCIRAQVVTFLYRLMVK